MLVQGQLAARARTWGRHLQRRQLSTPKPSETHLQLSHPLRIPLRLPLQLLVLQQQRCCSQQRLPAAQRPADLFNLADRQTDDSLNIVIPIPAQPRRRVARLLTR